MDTKKKSTGAEPPYWKDEVPVEEDPILAFLQREPNRWAVVQKDLGFMEAVMFQTQLKQKDKRIRTRVDGILRFDVCAMICTTDTPPEPGVAIGTAREDIRSGEVCRLVVEKDGTAFIERWLP